MYVVVLQMGIYCKQFLFREEEGMGTGYTFLAFRNFPYWKYWTRNSRLVSH